VRTITPEKGREAKPTDLNRSIETQGWVSDELAFNGIG